MTNRRSFHAKYLLAIGIVLLFGASTPLFAAYNGYLMVTGIEGESTAAGHQNWIDIESYSHGVYTTPTIPGAGAQAAKHQELVIVKAIDKASPRLSQACCAGSVIPAVLLQLHIPTFGQPMFLEIRLENVLVTAVRPSGAAADSGPVYEEVKFSYSRIQWTYNRIDGAGTIVETIVTGWNVETNSPWTPTGPANAKPAVLELR